MHDRARLDDFAAKGLADGLVTKAHAENGQIQRRLTHKIEADAGLIRRARAGR